jgi:hypothetical protein
MIPKHLVLITSLAGIILGGCHKQDANSTPSAAPNSTDPAAQAAQAPPPAAVASRAENPVKANVTGQPDPFLTAQLRTFIKNKGRIPASFAEFARQALDSIPQPPAGTKWVIDSADKTVKAVSAQ